MRGYQNQRIHQQDLQDSVQDNRVLPHHHLVTSITRMIHWWKHWQVVWTMTAISFPSWILIQKSSN